MEHRKTEKSNLENKRAVFFLIGLLGILCVTYAALSKKSFVTSSYDFEMQVEDDLAELPPVTAPPPPPPPPPPPAKPPVEPELEIVPDEVEIEEPDFEDDFADMEIDMDAPEPSNEVEEIADVPLMFVKNQPHFTECADLKTNLERDQCTKKLINQRIMENFTVPEIDKEIGASGIILVQFVISKTGEVKNVQIVKGMNDRLDKEAINALKKLPKMIPGKTLDKPVSIMYNIPIRINIQ